MFDRLHFLVVYVGSAALVAFVAASLSSPRIATFRCDGPANQQQCALASTLAAAEAAEDDANADPRGRDRTESIDPAALALATSP